MSENMTDWKNLEFLLVILFDIVIIIFVVNWFQKKLIILNLTQKTVQR